MAVDGHLNFDTRLDPLGFQKGLDKLENAAAKTGKAIRNALVSAFTTIGLTLGIKESIEAAASVNAACSQLEQTFDSLQTSAEAAMQSVADASGILKTRLQGVGTSIYAFAKASGMESVQALDMMQEALQVTADSAAYYDRSLEDVSESLQSFLKGNYANDAALGVSCTETTRNAAANKLYAKSFSELSEAQKQLVLLQMVKDANALSGAVGQAAREADGWENVLGNLKESWKQLLAVVGQPILHIATTAVKALASALTALTQTAQIAVNTLNELFGWEQLNASAVASAISDSTAEQNALTEAVEATAKAQENQLAGFDKIQKLGNSGETSENSGTSGETAVSSSLLPAASDTASRIQETFAGLKDAFEPLRQAWNDYGQPLTESVRTAWEMVKNIFDSIEKSFASVWKNGTGYTVASTLLQIFTDIFTTIGSIAKQFGKAWDSGRGTSIVQNLADIFQTILDTIHGCTSATAEWAENVDFQPLLNALDGLLEAVQPFAENIGTGLEWFYTNVLLPLAGWTIEEVIPDFLNTLTDAVEGINKVLIPLGNWISEHPQAAVKIAALAAAVTTLAAACKAGAFAKIASSIGQFIGKLAFLDVTLAAIIAGIMAWGYVITEVSENWEDICDVMEESGGIFGFLSGWLEYAMEDIEEFFSFGDFGKIWLEFWEGVGDAIYTAVHWWQNTFEGFGTFLYELMHEKIPQFFQDCYQGITDTFFGIGEWFSNKFTDAWNAITQAFSGMKRWAFSRLSEIKETFSNVSNWFSEKFTAAWNGITKAFSNVKTWFTSRWTEIKDVFSSVGSWFFEKFGDAWTKVKEPFQKAGSFFTGIWNNIKSPFEGIADWFRETFSNAWQAVLDVFSSGGSVFHGIQIGISSIFTDTVNSLIDGINNVISIPFQGINDALWSLRNFEFLGGQPFAWLPEISIPEIPRLAAGTVVPANYGEFLAVLGDNKRETEVISPLSTMERAMENVLCRNGGTGGDIHLTVELDGKKIYKSIIKRNQESIRMTGKNPLAGNSCG